MILPESAAATDAAFSWKTYSVKRSDKEPLLRFILDALRLRGCEIKHESSPDRAPFYIVFETPGGDRHGLLVYAFLANARVTRNRPDDEHRFQVKYGSELKGILEIGIDPRELITTIFLGIDLERGIFVAGDPIMNNPSPMSRSVEFKAENVEQIMASGWSAWERDRKPPRTRDRPTPEIDEDIRTQILVGGTREHLLDLVMLERVARGLDPGERHLLADTILRRPEKDEVKAASHKLLTEFDLPPEALFDLIDGASRLKMAVRGWVAEQKLEGVLQEVPGVTDCKRLNEEGRPDLQLRWKGGPPILIECKNVLRKTTRDGHPRLDFQRTRASKADPCSRYYAPHEFAVLAACLHATTEQWRFSYALTGRLPAHSSCKGRLASGVTVAAPLFTEHPEAVFSECSPR